MGDDHATGQPLPAPPDLVRRHFAAAQPDPLWVADITYVPTGEGFVYLAGGLDTFSRRLVGWSMHQHLRTDLVIAALTMALHQRKPARVIHHSDQGCQYTSIAFGMRCQEAGVRPSMGSVGDCFDNAMCESFFATLDCELLERHRCRTRAEAMLAVFEFIEGWYNPHRRHSALDYASPMQYERNDQAAGQPKASTRPPNGGNFILQHPALAWRIGEAIMAIEQGSYGRVDRFGVDGQCNSFPDGRRFILWIA